MPVFTGKQYEEKRVELEETRVFLRQEFLEQQDWIPEARTFDGCEYKRQDDQLLAQLELLERQRNFSKYLFSQRQDSRSNMVSDIERALMGGNGKPNILPPAPKYKVVWNGAMKGRSSDGCSTSSAFRGKTRSEIGAL